MTTRESRIVAEIDVERREWRERSLGGLLRAAAVTLAVGAGWLASLGDGLAASAFVAMALMAGLLSSGRFVAYSVRVGVLIVSIIAAGAMGMVLLGPSPNSFIAFSAAIVLAAILLGRRWSLWTVAVTAVLIGLIGASHRLDLLPRRPDWVSLIDVAQPAVALRVLTMYLLAATLLSLALSALIQRAEALALDKARSLEALTREQEERSRVQAELARRETAYIKAHKLEVLGRLSATVAHDFNNVLAVMTAAITELEKARLPGNLEQVVADLRAATEQATATTRQLRVLGRTAPKPPTQVALAPLLQRASSTFKRLLPKSVEVILDVQAEPVVRADDGQLMGILTNLALNARDAMCLGGRLTLRLREVPGPVALAAVDVADTGEGMNDEVKAHLFEHFFTTKGDRGTGLGLASVREIVESAGGWLAVDSGVGRGSTVTVFWPTAPPASS